VTSSLVIDEVIYALMLLKASEHLPGKTLKAIKKQLEMDGKLVKECYHFVQQIMDYIEILRLSGFAIQSVNFGMIKESCSLGAEYRLYPRDAVHALTCNTFGIHHIATNDFHFQKVPFLNIWSP
jgi:predicted nucleic acid-binding protein